MSTTRNVSSSTLGAKNTKQTDFQRSVEHAAETLKVNSRNTTNVKRDSRGKTKTVGQTQANKPTAQQTPFVEDDENSHGDDNDGGNDDDRQKDNVRAATLMTLHASVSRAWPIVSRLAVEHVEGRRALSKEFTVAKRSKVAFRSYVSGYSYSGAPPPPPPPAHQARATRN